MPAEEAPLLPTSGAPSRAGAGRFNHANTVGVAMATVAFLVLYGSDFFTRVGARENQLANLNEREEAPALSPAFVDRLNSRFGRTWTARVPTGWEYASHADLKRMAGGRLSVEPRGDAWTTSEFATHLGGVRDAPAPAVAADAADAAPAFRATGRQHRESALGQFARAMGGLSGRLGGFIEDFIGGPQPARPFTPSEWGLPDEFDARERWPECAGLIGGGRDQGNCGSCWAMAPAEVMSDRLCIQTGGRSTAELSPYQLLSCATRGAMGCMGGESSVAYEYAKEVGIVTGGKLGDAETCAPYPFAACHHPCTVFPTPECPTECANSNGPFGTMDDKVSVERITSCPSFDLACIAKELYNNGPVSSYAGDIYEDFYTYADGVFRESKDSKTRGENHGGHVIKIIGWGKEKGGSGGYYWIIVNSWLNWGERGIGKVAVGEVGIGAGVESAVMRVPTALGGSR